VFRAKGVALGFASSNRRHLFHLCGKRFTIDDSDWRKAALGTPKVVGDRQKDIDQAGLKGRSSRPVWQKR